MQYKAWFQCINEKCNEQYPLNTIIYRCKNCNSLLEVQHDVNALSRRDAKAWMKLFEDRSKSTQWPYGSGVWGKKEWILDKRELLPAGCVLTSDILQSIMSSDQKTKYKKYRLMDYGSTKKDLLYFLKIPPYLEIFNDRKLLSELVQLMENVSLALPFLESLDYFLEYDSYTYRHILMVFALSTLLAKDLVPNYKQRIKRVSTSPTHDLGKTCIPMNILKKTTPLTKAEYKTLEHHTTAGYVLISYYQHNHMDLAAIVARDHHEKKNGSGYPRGIQLEDLLVEIIATCDVYDALISPRPYRPVSFDNRTALEEITSRAERNEINWEVVRLLISYNRKNNNSKVKTHVSLEKRGSEPPGNIYGKTAE